MRTALHGCVETGFQRVADAFATNFARHGDIGAACCVYVDGRPVVDIWSGDADREAGSPWQEDTLQLVFSTSKGATAICAHLLAQRGLLDLDAPVAEYWPEFAANGKAAIPVRWVLCHRAGLADVDADLTLDEVLAWDPVVEALAAQAPNWEPGTVHGYHARSFGWLTGEIVRRITGRTLGRFLAEEVAAPLGIEFWIGLPESLEPRVSRVYPPDPPADPEIRKLMEALMSEEYLMGRVMTGPSNLFRYDEMWNTRAIHGAELPSSNGITGARDVARLYAATIGDVDNVRVLAPETVAGACDVQAEGNDHVIGFPMRFGTGFMLGDTLAPSAPSGAFGHSGAGGSLGFADATAGVGFGYVMNRMRLDPVGGDPRADSLVRAVYASLG